ncbi:adenylate/guanylate cyclase domain-containing protein (plasmid) [Methylocystis sp. MJC1]|jgi:adenylate cyclase|uniref:adenylate/guanylate cyclase domain-containing protein n=1 Tax=Methylocystis sp. MJC1 TaxID=2654282 RepID=UPI0013EA7BFC|nr:adenylate/guanylate cyclase domain-containing protein [Methylocystis sp. MJC1]KAF2991491.1 Adenylate cyclase 1 [Methylocystis sp. MJC1]MBU6529195.1 adenylate/guanylate cyclase domain-containing protein [Methylocystis sp. MJC1]UZX13875.1 adenylate/guanylate cyclase domain-containing protein [Methylocystis sp. MJC1]
MPALGVNFDLERTIRLATGLTLFTYAACHFLSHATGLLLLDNLQAIGHGLILRPWRTPGGVALLLTCFTLHLCLGLYALFRRRHLRMPAIEAWQLGLGLTIPLLLAPHVTDTRVAVIYFGLEDSYFRILYHFWITDPTIGLPRQFLLMALIWTHGCIGIHMWLRYRDWYRRRALLFLLIALAVPAFAIAGLINAGWEVILRAYIDDGFIEAHGPPARSSPHAQVPAALGAIIANLQIGYLVLLAAVLLLRWLRNAYERRLAAVRIDYRDGRRVHAPRGYSVLEASRFAGIPHASVCGGRMRCTTCRFRVLRGAENLSPPQPAEHAALARIGAPEGVRLGCQARPRRDLAVYPLIPADRPLDGLRVDLDQGREIFVTAMFVDLRDSTKLAANRLPYDAIFIIDAYIRATTTAILARGGVVTSVAGDGVMSLYRLDGDAAEGARAALRAASAIWREIERLSEEFAHDLEAPLSFGIGLHSGLSVVGVVGASDRQSVQFLGDTGNVAARLESLTKEMNCVAIVSAATCSAAQFPPPPAWPFVGAPIRGRDAATPALLFERLDDYEYWLEYCGEAPARSRC